MHVGRMPAFWCNKDVKVCSHWPYTVSYRGKTVYMQTSWYATSYYPCLLATEHRTHTVIECDKSFTRSDALTKHMRVVHGIEPLAPHHQARPAGTGAGGSTSHGAKGKSTGKKRKRGGRADDESDEEELPAGVLESGDDDGLDDGIAGTEDDTWGPVGRRRRSRKSKAGPGIGTGVKVEDTGVYGAPTGSRDLWSEDESDYEALEREADEMGLVGGNTLSKAKYLTVKAKYRCVIRILYSAAPHLAR